MPVRTGPKRIGATSTERFGAFGRSLHTLRLEMGLSQAALAARAGVTQQAISRLELGRCEPTWATVRAIVSALDADLAVFQAADGVRSRPASGRSVRALHSGGRAGVPRGHAEDAVDRSVGGELWRRHKNRGHGREVPARIGRTVSQPLKTQPDGVQTCTAKGKEVVSRATPESGRRRVPAGPTIVAMQALLTEHTTASDLCRRCGSRGGPSSDSQSPGARSGPSPGCDGVPGSVVCSRLPNHGRWSARWTRGRWCPGSHRPVPRVGCAGEGLGHPGGRRDGQRCWVANNSTWRPANPGRNERDCATLFPLEAVPHAPAV